MTLTKTAKQLD